MNITTSRTSSFAFVRERLCCVLTAGYQHSRTMDATLEVLHFYFVPLNCPLKRGVNEQADRHLMCQRCAPMGGLTVFYIGHTFLLHVSVFELVLIQETIC